MDVLHQRYVQYFSYDGMSGGCEAKRRVAKFLHDAESMIFLSCNMMNYNFLRWDDQELSHNETMDAKWWISHRFSDSWAVDPTFR